MSLLSPKRDATDVVNDGNDDETLPSLPKRRLRSSRSRSRSPNPLESPTRRRMLANDVRDFLASEKPSTEPSTPPPPPPPDTSSPPASPPLPSSPLLPPLPTDPDNERANFIDTMINGPINITEPIPINKAEEIVHELTGNAETADWFESVHSGANNYELALILYFYLVQHAHYPDMDPLTVFRIYKHLLADNVDNVSNPLVDYYNLFVRIEAKNVYYVNLEKNTYNNAVNLWKNINEYVNPMYNFVKHKFKDEESGVVSLHNESFVKSTVIPVHKWGKAIDNFPILFKQYITDRQDSLFPMSGYITMELAFVPKSKVTFHIPTGSKGPDRLVTTVVKPFEEFRYKMKFFINSSLFDKNKYRKDHIHINEKDIVLGLDPTIIFIEGSPKNRTVDVVMFHRFEVTKVLE